MKKCKKMVYFDMDGTLANLYQVPQWLERLRAFDPDPYYEAPVIGNMSQLSYILNELQKAGYKLGIISWLAMGSNPDYDNKVRIKKRKWLEKHLHSVAWDEIHLVKHGTPKHLVIKDKDSILFDDNADVRSKWKGLAYSEKEIITILKGLL